jgi:hypothetical protein
MGSIVDPAEVALELGLSSSITEEERAVVRVAITKSEGAVKKFLGYDPTQRERTEYYPQTDYNFGHAQHVWEATATTAYVREVAEEASSELQIRHVPIRNVPAIDLRIDYDGRGGSAAGAFAAETLRTEGEDYWPNYGQVDSDGNRVCFDGLIRSIGLWPTVAGSVRIVYTAGYTDDELHGADDLIDASPIVEAVLEEAKRRVEGAFVRRKHGVGWVPGIMSSESLGDYSYSIDTALASKLFGSSKDLTDQAKLALGPFVNMGWNLA